MTQDVDIEYHFPYRITDLVITGTNPDTVTAVSTSGDESFVTMFFTPPTPGLYDFCATAMDDW